MEKCDLCQIDHREDNCFTGTSQPSQALPTPLTLSDPPAGVDILGEREPISVEFTFNKDGVPQCKKHKATMCNNCVSSCRSLSLEGESEKLMVR